MVTAPPTHSLRLSTSSLLIARPAPDSTESWPKSQVTCPGGSTALTPTLTLPCRRQGSPVACGNQRGVGPCVPWIASSSSRGFRRLSSTQRGSAGLSHTPLRPRSIPTCPGSIPRTWDWKTLKVCTCTCCKNSIIVSFTAIQDVSVNKKIVFGIREQMLFELVYFGAK